MTHSTPPAVVLSRAESDARFGGFDFRVAHAEADADLRSCSTTPTRRSGGGHERDAEDRRRKGGFAQLRDEQQASGSSSGSRGSGADGLVAVPQAVAHFALDAFERPVQAQVVELLLPQPTGGSRVACCAAWAARARR